MRGLSPGQQRNAYEERLDYRLAHADTSAMILDPKDFCGLMASECFDIVKCMLYSRSASLSCRQCPTRYPLEKTGEAIWSVRGTKMATVGTCEKCEQHKTLVAGNQCHRCKYGDWKDFSKSQVLNLLSNGKVRTRKSPAKPSLGPTGPTSSTGEVQTLQGVLEGAKILTDFSKDQPLFEKILLSAKKSRRPAGDHVLHLIEKGLNNDHSEISSNLIKIIDKIRRYPLPEGSPKEVYAKTLDLITIRLEEYIEGL